MAENTEIVIKEDDPKGPKNLFSLFPKFKLQLPFLKQEPEAASVVVAEEPRKPEEGTESKTPKPVFMSFPKAQVVAPPPVAVECEEPITKTSNPIILWQAWLFYPGGLLLQGEEIILHSSGLIRACVLHLEGLRKGFQKINVDFLLKIGDDTVIST
ncbi:hypothetical protein ACFX1Q_040105 [Malus domestica]